MNACRKGSLQCRMFHSLGTSRYTLEAHEEGKVDKGSEVNSVHVRIVIPTDRCCLLASTARTRKRDSICTLTRAGSRCFQVLVRTISAHCVVAAKR